MSIFTKIGAKRPRFNKFDLSHERKFSFGMGKLTPILVQDILPGDKFRVKSEIFIRMAPMLAPIMHRVNVYTHYFFVPNRLVWNEWEDFVTGGKNGDLAPVPPYFNYEALGSSSQQIQNLMKPGTLMDFMGLPTFSDPSAHSFAGGNFSALPFRAYQMIYNEYYRDQNLSDPIEILLDSGDADTGDQLEEMLTMRARAWEKDYFTSALPWAQRGGAVSLPIDSEADITYKHPAHAFFDDGSSANAATEIYTDMQGNLVHSPSNMNIGIDNIESVDISSTNTTINDLRRSIRLQEWLEKNARGGARYVEQILSHFGVRSSDSRLQRPEYLGGGRQPVVISEVLSTFQDEQQVESNPLATMAGHGVSTGRSSGFTRRFEEHGYVIGLISVIPKTAYQQGMPRHFSRTDKFDYAWPEFANIGEQEIKNKELYFQTDQTVSNENTFGYAPRYSEYKYAPSTVHGSMKDSLSYWHMGRIFSAPPVLNENFVASNPTTRIFAVEDEEHMYCQLYNSVSALRPLPYFGTPTL